MNLQKRVADTTDGLGARQAYHSKAEPKVVHARQFTQAGAAGVSSCASGKVSSLQILLKSFIQQTTRMTYACLLAQLELLLGLHIYRRSCCLLSINRASRQKCTNLRVNSNLAIDEQENTFECSFQHIEGIHAAAVCALDMGCSLKCLLCHSKMSSWVSVQTSKQALRHHVQNHKQIRLCQYQTFSRSAVGFKKFGQQGAHGRKKVHNYRETNLDAELDSFIPAMFHPAATPDAAQPVASHKAPAASAGAAARPATSAAQAAHQVVHPSLYLASVSAHTFLVAIAAARHCI